MTIDTADTNAEVAAAVASLFSLDQEAINNPYPTYQLMREKQPVIRSGPLVAVSRYEDVKSVLRDTTTFTSVRSRGTRVTARRAQLSPEDAEKLDALVASEGSWMVQQDDPEHARIRRFVNHAFSAARIAGLRDKITAISDDLLDTFDATGSDELELVSQYAYRLPLRVVCELLGADKSEIESIRTWSDAIGTGLGTEYSNIDEAFDALAQFKTYVTGLIARSRNDPDTTDLFSELVSTDDNGTFMDENDLTAMFVQLLFAGHETTTNLLGNALVQLLRHPDQLEILRADPSLIRPAVDEFLRFCPSIQAVHRVATKDCEIAGFPVKEGETIRILLASANRDDVKFDDPDTLDVTRKNAKQHVGLGFGIHSCLGMWLTRLEIEIGLSALIERYPSIELAEPVDNRLNFTLHGPGAVRLRIRRRAGIE